MRFKTSNKINFQKLAEISKNIYLCTSKSNTYLFNMTYQDFTNTFIPNLALLYQTKQISLHGLVDFNLWSQILPESEELTNDFQWRKISFNAFVLEDDEKSLLIVYSIPLFNQKKEAEFIGIRLNNNRDKLILYSLRRPKYHDDAWDICQYDFDKKDEVFLDKIKGTDSMREFMNAIQQLEFKEKPTIIDRVLNFVYN